MANEAIMIVEKDIFSVDKCDVNILALILSIYHKSSFELNLEICFTVCVAGNEVCSLPVIG